MYDIIAYRYLIRILYAEQRTIVVVHTFRIHVHVGFITFDGC